MADTLAEAVENMDLGGTDGDTSAASTDSTAKDVGSGAEHSGAGTGEPKSNADDKGDVGEGQNSGDQGNDGSKNDGASGESASTTTGYVADEVEEDGTVEPPKPKEAEQPNQAISPDLQYVVDRLPNLAVRGKDGKNYQIKAAGQLPEDFEFATKRDELMFNQAIAGQELKAQQLLGEYNSKQQQDAAAKYSTQENEDIRHDIGDLQREGLLARFQHNPTDPQFTSDPAVKTAQEVMEYMNEKNEKYAKANKLYRISFRDAFDQMARDGKVATTKEERGQAKEDKERKTVTRQTAGAKSTTGGKNSGPKVHSSMESLISRIESMDL